LVRTTKPLELTVVFTDRKVIRALNRRHRGINAPTDVLSFSYPPDVRTAPWAGEIVICVPQARAQAKQYGHSLLKEITLLAVHGFLHIVGFDHATQRQATRMRRLENSVLGMSGSRTES
jgi:probable rRNA maturation factor